MDSPDVHVLSVGTALPGPPVDNTALARRFGMDPLWEQWVDVFVGTRTRHLSFDLPTGTVRSTLAELGAEAARTALARAGVGPDEVDLVVMGTATPDALMPATVNVVADLLGIDGVPTYQLQSGCAGAVQALDVAARLLATGAGSTALVVAGDVSTKFFDLSLDLTKLAPAELVNVVLFGDGAGAAVLSTAAAPGAAVIRRLLNQLVGRGRAPGHQLNWFGPADRDADVPGALEDYTAIAESVPQLALEVLEELLAGLGWTRADLSYLLPPQLNVRMTEQIVARLAVPAANEISCVQDTANTGNALPFLQLEQALDKMASGERLIGVAIESSKWIKSGFALERV
ncbi:3-oxoacyl-ACP synthase III family protein [Actinoplanes sp. N902-109]|uniref:3-oxoacyl-ACP synthase III family protein n=1 Tax=Actinoplanes sp. (strain N902-109) TaxID=649831 RepID=UPI000329627C|nr:3-oxoacyl-ACP synthase III family protein [Actinoplanes sp. N902-109]AGL15974.1 beta-ketoacyl-acyl-carrier-protein synthase III [Actinoplanes sp. N902-109]